MQSELIKVYQDTLERVQRGEYPSTLEATRFSTTRHHPPAQRVRKSGIISVENEDCARVAQRLVKSGRSCMLNMANGYQPGGGVYKGQTAQEEEICRRSNLMFGLPKEYYPIAEDGGIYTQEVTFFKDATFYQLLEQPFECDVITIPAVRLGWEETPANYEELMENKISTMLALPYQYGCKHLILGAFGCGVFGNDPRVVATIFKRLLDEGFASLYSQITFAILDDRRTGSANRLAFEEILHA